jgi:hypothetical protein
VQIGVVFYCNRILSLSTFSTWGCGLLKELIPIEIIETKIYLVRGHKVMLDKDLAVLYGVKPIRLREQVKRNLMRFPGDFMFQLSEEEIDVMVSQNAIPSKKYLGGYNPYVLLSKELQCWRLYSIVKEQYRLTFRL